MELLGNILNSFSSPESTETPLAPKLYGNAGGIYQDILEEIEALSEDPLVVSRVKELAMPAIAKVLQNKLVIAMDWKSAQQEGLPIESENEFTKLLAHWEEWETDWLYDQDEINAVIIDKFNVNASRKKNHQELRDKLMYAKFLQFFPEDEHQAVLDAIANKESYWNLETQQGFFVNNMKFTHIFGESSIHLTWNIPKDEIFHAKEFCLSAVVQTGLPVIVKHWSDKLTDQVFPFDPDHIDNQINEFVKESSRTSGEDLAYYKKWAWENQKDPLGLLPDAFPEDRIDRELAGINW